MKKTDFLGIDISKDSIDCALLNAERPGSFSNKHFGNDLDGFEAMHKWLIKNKTDFDRCLFCMEHTGTYGLLLFAWLGQRGADFCVEPGLKIKRSLGMTRGKDDQIDARRIADYAYTHVNKLKLFTLPSQLIINIKQLFTFREQLVRIRTSLKNSIKSHEQYEQITKDKTITSNISAIIEDYNTRIMNIEKQIVKLIKSDEDIQKNFVLSTSVKGIGFVIATFMLVTTNNFTAFNEGRQYACYSGVAPFANTSGTSIRGKSSVSHLANKTIKTLLSQGANSASKWDPELRSYYNRKKDEGKDHKLIINAISCKLINRVFAVVKRQSPYVITYQQKMA